MLIRLFASLMLFFLISGLEAQKLVIHPVPDSITSNRDFTVKVRVPGGKWQDLFEYQVQVDMHNVRASSMVNFDFEGTVEVSVTANSVPVRSARIRPSSLGITPVINGNNLSFTLSKPCNLSVEVNDDIFHNLQIFTNPLETFKPDPNDPGIVYIKPGIHTYPNGTLRLSDGKTLYLAGGAIVKAAILCDSIKNVRICGRGIIYQPNRGVEIKYSSNVEVNDIIFINPQHYTVFAGQSSNIAVKNIRSFSSRGWSDGIDMMSCSDVSIDGVFMRNSDDCIALYCHRWKYYGDCKNIVVTNSTLWADVAHPIMIGTHGNPDAQKAETLENITFRNIDILNHDEPQLNYQGCITINVSDENLARNIRFENIRIDDFEQGQLVNLRVTYNKKYATAPGRGIENIYFKDITYTGSRASTSIIEGYNETRSIKNIIFENLSINGRIISKDMKKPGYFQVSDMAKFYVGPHVEGVEFIASKGN